ncbi:uncharacterized protein LOC123310188 [Coccinella septempunctata]|uniref:uncharacterized protein LOC123310188 n=1 Tax=Coccinella septempunctata TaxID=41139 RepID=UPI001D078A76|nr:uncharacterized protein LOC123310188 [Coccinella septempunctata]
MWKKKCSGMGIPLNDETTLYTLCFADDQILIAQDQDDLNYMTRKLVEEYKKWGLEVNVKKTESMCIGGTPQNITLEDGTQISHCTEYRYLGMKLTHDGTLDAAIKDRNVQGRKAISMMNGILWDQSISKSLTWTPRGRRRRGRPRKSWREGIEKEMEERELPENLWLNREEWRLGVGKRRRTL